MPLFKVWSRDGKQKCFVLTETDNVLLNLISTASKKLQLNGSSLVLEEDGTPIIEDEVLLMLQKETVILLQQGEEWIPYEEDKKSIASASTISVISENFSDEFGQPPNKIDPVYLASQTNIIDIGEATEFLPSILVDQNMEYMWNTFDIPWYKLPKDTVAACEEGKKRKEIITQVIHMVANEIRSIKANPSSTSVRIVAQKIIAKYPKMFQDIDDDGVVLGDGSISIFMKLYERISYLNRPHKRSPYQPAIPKKIIKHAVAGCSHWNPEIIAVDNEGNESKMTKNKLNEMQDADFLSEEMKNLLEETFSEQRECINNIEKPPTVKDILKEWPILFNTHILAWHFQKLCNTDLKSFEDTLHKKAEKILKFDKENNRGEDPCIRVLKLPSNIFKEDMSKIYKVLDIEPTENETDLQPYIIEIESESGKVWNIYYENIAVIARDKFGEALQLLLGIYFVFNLAYPKSASCILEFLQRYILKIHPDEGTKSKKLNLSKRKVISFLNKLSEF